MSKKIVVLLVMAMALVLGGCGESNILDDLKAKGMEEVNRLKDEAMKSGARAIIVATEKIEEQRAELGKIAADKVETGTQAVEDAGTAASEVLAVPAEK